jgi:hypothetical protein
MRPRRILVAIVGTLQSVIGLLAVIFAYFLYIDLFGLQAWLNGTAEFLPLHMLFLVVFGFFSIMSGLFLLTERESP